MSAVYAEVEDRRRRFEERQLELQPHVAEESRLVAAGVPTPQWPARNVTDARAKMHDLTRALEDRVNAELAEG